MNRLQLSVNNQAGIVLIMVELVKCQSSLRVGI